MSGVTEAKAREAGLAVHSVSYGIGNIAGAALLADGYSGWAKQQFTEMGPPN